MKTTASRLFFCLLLFVCTRTQAQQRFIDVTGYDTIRLKPVGIVYELTMGKDPLYNLQAMMEEQEKDVKKNLQPVKLEDVEKMLTKEKFTYELVAAKPYAIPQQVEKLKIEVTLTSESELKRLLGLLGEQNGLSGRIKEIKYEPAAPYLEASYKRLYNHALTQAKMMAAVSGNAVGQLISVSETANELDNTMGYLSRMFKKFPMNELFGDSGLEIKEEVRTFHFKFELK